jgi:MGT family glycosyltransferase
MGRILIVVPPLVGHVNPTVSVGNELSARGHDVAWTGHAEVVPDLLAEGSTFIPAAGAAPPEVTEAMHASAATTGGGAAGFKAAWDVVLALAPHMARGVDVAAAAFRPDVLIVDQHAPAGVAVAVRRGLPWATSASTSVEFTDPLAFAPRIADWLRTRLREALVACGLPEERAAAVDPRFSPHLVLGFTTHDLVGGGPFPDHWALVGPAVSARPDTTPFPWERLEAGRPAVLVTLGTLNWTVGGRFFAVAAEALGGMDVQGVIVAPPGAVPDPPPNVIVRSRVPQIALLRRMAAVVSHGGHNTVCESLAAGVPLVLAPVRDDQPVVADQVVRAGAGVRVKFKRISVPMLRDALASVLGRPDHRAAAERVGRSFAAAGGARAAADRVETLLPAAPAGPETSLAGPGAPATKVPAR